MATATYTVSQITSTTFQYSLTLTDTGTTTIGTFWFSWVPGEDFMPVAPMNINSPNGWSDLVTHGGPGDGFAIQWVATPADVIAPGNTLAGFQFQSTMTPAELMAANIFYPDKLPVATAFVFSGAPFSDAGFQLTAAMSPVPEPSMMLGTVTLLGGLAIARFRRSTNGSTI